MSRFAALAAIVLVAALVLLLVPEIRAGDKEAGTDFPYGEGVVYKREVLYGSFATGAQDGPAVEVEMFGAGGPMLPNGDRILFEGGVNQAVYRYDAKKKRIVTLSAGCPYGMQGGPIEAARFAAGGYMRGMSLTLEPSGSAIRIFDRNNNGAWWRWDLETGIVAPFEGADATKGTAVRGFAPDGSMYFAKGDGKLMKRLPDGTTKDLGVTLEQPLSIPTFNGNLVVSEETGRLFTMARDPYSPWGIVWYWDMKTGKATGVAGPKKGDTPDKEYRCASGPAGKVSFWCASGLTLGPDRGKRYVYLGGGDESTCSRIDLEKKYVYKMVRADAKGDKSLWTFGEGKQGKDYRFADPYRWPGPPSWGPDGEYYMGYALCTKLDVYRPVKK